MHLPHSVLQRAGTRVILGLVAAAALAACAATRPTCDPVSIAFQPSTRSTTVRAIKLPLLGLSGYRLTASFSFPGEVPSAPDSVLVAIAGAPAHEQLRGAHAVRLVLDDGTVLNPGPRYYGMAENHNGYESVAFRLTAPEFRRVAAARNMQLQLGQFQLRVRDSTQAALRRVAALTVAGAAMPDERVPACPAS